MIRILFFLVCFITGISQHVNGQSERVLPNCSMHIIIALDFSASERAYLDEIQTVLLALTSRFELHPSSLRIGIISFNRGAQIILPLTGDTGKLEETIAELRIPVSVYATDIHAGIELANREFRKNSDPSVPKFFVLVSDGDPHAHSRGYGFQADLKKIEKLRKGDASQNIDPVHVFCIYSGRDTPFNDRFSENVRKASIIHMQKMASDPSSFFFFEQYPELVSMLEDLSSCL